MIVDSAAQNRRAARQRQLEDMETAAAGGQRTSHSSVDTSGIDMLMGESSLRSRSSRGGRSKGGRSVGSNVMSPEGSTDGTMGSDSLNGSISGGLINKVVSAPRSSARNIGKKPKVAAQAGVSGAPLLKPLTGVATGTGSTSGSGSGKGSNTGSKPIASGGGFFTQRNNMYDVDQTVNLMNPDAATYERRGSSSSSFTTIISETCTPRRALFTLFVIVIMIFVAVSINSMENAKSSASDRASRASVASIDNTLRKKPPSEEESFNLKGPRADKIKELILNQKISKNSDFEDDENSPQSKALRWLADEDTYDIAIEYKNKDTILQRYGLMVMYYSTKAVLAVASDGFFGSSKEVTTEWTNDDNWGTNTSYCSWYGVSCILTDDFPANFAGTSNSGSNLRRQNQNDVITLNLTSNNLAGKIPSELAKSLLQVREVDLSSNSFTGTIPYNLFRMYHLRYLILSHNSLTGTISKEIEKFEGARDIFLDSNKLTGTIPSEINGLYNLRGLYLDHNDFTGKIPLLFGMKNLAFMHLQSNRLSDFFPFSISQLTNLFDLRMQDNKITGTIPPEIDNLSHLEIFYAYENKIRGSLPNVFEDLKQLVDLRLQHNDFDGSLPKTLGGCVNLKHLILDGNMISGAMPSEYGNLVELETLILSNNTLVGTVPTEFGRLKALTELWLNRNFLQHDLPTEMGQMTSLKNIYLNHNAFASNVPSEIGYLNNLNALRLATNQVTGAMPAEICSLKEKSLQYLDADCKEPKITCSCCNVCR